MTTIINYLILIMATGNKCIIVCPNVQEKMFPFTETLSCLLPIGDTCLLQRLLEEVKSYPLDEIILIGELHKGLEAIAQTYQVQLKELKNLTEQLYEEMQTCENVLLLQGNTWIDKNDIKQLMELIEKNTCGALVKEYEKYEKSTDGFGVQATDEVQAIYAHPRAHYVNGKICPAYAWNSSMKDFIKECNCGFHNVNCGQMPDKAYYVEEAMQEAIEQGIDFQSIWIKNPFIELIFPWNIAEANIFACHEVEKMKKDAISKDTIIDSSCIRQGYLTTEEDVVIGSGVIFEGNCKIGKHVVIDNGVIIGKNCIINDYSTLRYQCRISESTAIGTHNKIGYHAEISGVTFDGVCAVHGCEIYGIIGKKVDLAAGVRMAILRFDDDFVTQHVQGKKYNNPYTNHIFIGDYCRTGVNNVFLPGIKVGSRSAIGPGVVIEKDVDANSLVLLKQETIIKEWGSRHYGW